MKFSRFKTNKMFKKAVALVTSLTMLTSSLCFPEISDVIKNIFTFNASAEVHTVTSLEVNSLKALYGFSKTYHEHPENYPRLHLTIDFGNDNEIASTKQFGSETLTWYPLGTKQYPFNGRIEIKQTAGTPQPIVVNEPLFGYVTDTVEIINFNNHLSQVLDLYRDQENDEAPLFAEHVVHDSDEQSSSSTWNIVVNAEKSYGSIIGNIGEESSSTSAHLNLELDSSAVVSTSANAGLICGTLYNNSAVNVNFLTSGSASSVNVTSTDKCAGAFVGEMYPGSEVDIIANGVYDISSASRTITGKTYAGGLVGKNNQGTVKILTVKKNANNEPVTDENGAYVYDENTYEALGTISATGGTAGGVFGYFKVKSDDNRFSPDYYTSKTTGVTLSGTTAGGLVGELDGNGVDISYSGTSTAAADIIKVKSTLSGNNTTYGGIVGSYSNLNLTKSFIIEHADVTMTGSYATNYGGAIGKIEGNSAVYVKANDFTLDSTGSVGSCSYFGGVVGSAGSQGSMLDIGNITIKTSKDFKGGGVVGQLSAGVLRLSGTTNLSNATASSGGQIVGERKDALVYALGSGEDTSVTPFEKGWRFVRSSTDAAVDDIGTWGEVVRIADVEGAAAKAAVEADPDANPPVEAADAVPAIPAIIAFDSTNHTATVTSAVTDMRSARDFVSTALNMQLNDGADKGALCFNDKTDTTTSSRRSRLLANTSLTIWGTINLAGTGITGFMRDGSTKSDNDSSEIKSFTGKLSKGTAGEDEDDEDAIIQLAVGERYGIYTVPNGTNVNTIGRGAIFSHRFNGLFARTGNTTSTTSIENITIDGYMNIRASSNDMNIGGAIAYLENAASLKSVNATETINYAHLGTVSNHYVGGLIGVTKCAAGKAVSIEGSSSTDKADVSPKIYVTGTGVNNVDSNLNANTVALQSVGGVIGYISSTAKATTSINNITLSATIDASGADAADYVSVAGLVSDIASYETFGTDTRTLSLSNIDITDTVVKNKANTASGGILGYRWFGTDVTFNNVSLSSDATGNELNTTSAYIGGLVYKATGRWTVGESGIAINSLAIKNGTSVASPTSLGIIVHDGYVEKDSNICGLFLEMTASNSYTLASGMSIPTMSSNYDELVYALAKNAASILTNETAGVVSYRTNGDYSMGGAGTRNSYNNVYNQTVVNNRSRYYYNADSVTYSDALEENGTTLPGYKLLQWSLNRYAAKNIQRCFVNPYTTASVDTISGVFDLEHISYYPIDISKPVTIGDATFIFYNANIEATETASNTKRSTRDTVTVNNVTSGKSQHYLMHMGLFKNVTSTITTTGDITMYGTVGVDSVYSGALINGKLTGSLNTATNRRIILGKSATKQSSVIPLEIVGESIDEKYLLINSIGNSAILDLNGVVLDHEKSKTYKTSSGRVYASSLIGDVKGTGISLKFNNIKLDARNTENVPSKLGGATEEGTYGTTKSIFKNATLLNSYDVDSTSVAVYNFSQSEDWYYDDDEEDYFHTIFEDGKGVTYGKELTDTQEFKDETTNLSEQNRYYEDGENGHYIDPEEYPGDYPSSGTVPGNSAYSFSTNFLPYVRYYNISVAPTGYEPDHTLREIKVNVVPSNLNTGCGTYDHPYVITSAKQLVSLSKMLDNSTNNDDNFGEIRLPLKANVESHWCASGEDHTCNAFTHSNGNYTSTTTSEEWNKNDVKAYLAKAYYQIGQNITLGTTFTGLGARDSAYAFKGVIVGLNSNITITNKSAVPLIKVSNGSVVRNLKVVVDNKDSNTHKSVLTNGTTATKFSYSNNSMVYGGVIGTIMGGDNIIDNVTLTYNNNGYVQVPTTNSYLDCVGGYVGVIVNGGLVFRNMTANSFTNKALFKVNTTLNNANTTNWVSSTDNSHLYINPYIGRVINGYAINETTGNSATYSGDPVAVKDAYGNDVYKYYDENGDVLTDVTDPETDSRVVKSVQQFKYVSILDNSTKNYQIADVVADIPDTNAAKLYYDTFASKNRVNIPTGQSLFILSLITQTGAGTATTVDGDYVYGVAYDCTDNANRYDTDSAAKNAATHLAQYNSVGSATVSSDYTLSTNDTYNSASAVPYIIHHYTKDDGNGKYPARMMTGNTEFMLLSTENGTYNLPVSFRGIGSICRFKGGDKTSIDLVQKYGTYISRYVDANRLQYNWEQADVNGTVDEDGKFSMKIYGFEGNGSTININLNYNIYADNQNNGTIADNYNNTIYTNGNINVAFGLFNYIKQKSNATTTLNIALYGKDAYRPETSTIPNYNLTSGYYIGNFTLSGNVIVHEYNNNGVLQGESSKRGQKDQTMYRHSVGGVIGATTVNDYVNFFKLDLVDMNVEGAANVGGFIGRNNVTERNVDYGNGMNYIYANACDTENLTVKSGGGYCGGFIAGGLSGYLDLFVNTAKNSDTSDTEHRGGDGYYKSTMEMSVSNNAGTAEWGTGGVLGSMRNGYLVNIWINNVTVCGANKKSAITNISTSTTETIGVGGLVGFVRKADTIILTNCSVENINISGPVAGGLTGCISKDTGYANFGIPPVMKVYNCTVTDNDADKTYEITAVRQAGGLCGNFLSSESYSTADNAKGYDYDSTKNNVYRYDIDGCEVSGYQIKVTNNANAALGSGGIIGYAANATRTVVNTSVHNCSIMIEGSNNNHGMGGIIGNTAVAVWGYNIAAYNNSFSFVGNNTNARRGGFVGNPNSTVLKIAGFTRKNNNLVTASATTAITADAGSATGTGSYVICADYMNVSTTDDHGTSTAVGFDNGTNVGPGGGTNENKNYFPYVTISPKVSAGNTNFLTGDGMSLVGDDDNKYPLAKLIKNESSGTTADNRIAYGTVGASATDISKVNELITRGEDTASDYDIKLTTYGKEMGLPNGYEANGGKDFPIIAINGAQTDYNDYINAYIRVLTNTTDNYAASGGTKFVVDIYPCKCIGGVYQKVTGTAGFKLQSGKFKMDDSAADSIAGNSQISMIDIRFLDPADDSSSGKTAYHLYIPVLTKKLLKFNFDSSALQGTEYEPSDYISKFPTGEATSSKLAAGFDTWQTIYVQFTYTPGEINKFLETGKGLNWNTSKALTLNYNAGPSLAVNTEYVLLDNNFNVDKEFYKKKVAGDTSLISGKASDSINFADFVERDGSTRFAPQKLMDIADKKISYTLDNSKGAYVMFEPTGPNDSSIAAYAYDGNTKVYFKKRTNETTGRYTLTISEDLKETYYLSMFAYKEDNPRTTGSSAAVNDAYIIEATCPVTFNSNVITCQKNSTHNTNIYLGEFLKQTMTMTNVTARQPMSASSSVIRATMTSEVSFDGDNAPIFHDKLAGESIYQGFYLYLNRYNMNGAVEADSSIKGQPTYKYTRSIDGTTIGGETTDLVDDGAPYLDFGTLEIVIPDYSEGWKSTQSVSATIDYGTNETNIIKEFPPNSGALNDGRGIGFEGKSRLDFNENQVKYSNMIKNEKRTERYYVNRSSSGGTLTLTAIDQPGNDGYDTYGEQSHNKSPLGVNGNYIRTGSEYNPELGDYEYIEIGMDYDVSNISVDDIFDNAHDLNIKIELEQKVDDDDPESTTGYKYVPVNIDDTGGANTGYLKDFKFFDRTGEGELTLTHSNDGGDNGYYYYTYSMRLNPSTQSSWPIKYTDTGAQKDFVANMGFYVKTNKALEEVAGYKYSNYRLKMTVSISGTSYSSPVDWIVYTNAKVNAQYVQEKTS
jgi:hypothetical protein